MLLAAIRTCWRNERLFPDFSNSRGAMTQQVYLRERAFSGRPPLEIKRREQLAHHNNRSRWFGVLDQLFVPRGRMERSVLRFGVRTAWLVAMRDRSLFFEMDGEGGKKRKVSFSDSDVSNRAKICVVLDAAFNTVCYVIDDVSSGDGGEPCVKRSRVTQAKIVAPSSRIIRSMRRDNTYGGDVVTDDLPSTKSSKEGVGIITKIVDCSTVTQSKLRHNKPKHVHSGIEARATNATVGDLAKEKAFYCKMTLEFSFKWDLTASKGAPIISEMPAKLLSLVYGGPSFRRNFIAYIVLNFLLGNKNKYVNLWISKSLIDINECSRWKRNRSSVAKAANISEENSHSKSEESESASENKEGGNGTNSPSVSLEEEEGTSNNGKLGGDQRIGISFTTTMFLSF
ncbi:hypothetical protein Cgig2_031985 [Carnegiea gigantea]|uniref:Uncharacterized protein n=1 Tax=Carnegiea gigantea TaxID=171969 RepID=A0A9Q1GPB7_9CARY|nr:hypothetical protein Cgig2_031985 [Carnegiea gigantea]